MPRPTVELQILRECQDRALHREGIPMFLALSDERNATVPAPASRAHSAVVRRMEGLRQALAPTQREDDMGVVLSIITVAAYEDFDSSVFP